MFGWLCSICHVKWYGFEFSFCIKDQFINRSRKHKQPNCFQFSTSNQISGFIFPSLILSHSIWISSIVHCIIRHSAFCIQNCLQIKKTHRQPMDTCILYTMVGLKSIPLCCINQFVVGFLWAQRGSTINAALQCSWSPMVNGQWNPWTVDSE